MVTPTFTETGAKSAPSNVFLINITFLKIKALQTDEVTVLVTLHCKTVFRQALEASHHLTLSRE